MNMRLRFQLVFLTFFVPLFTQSAVFAEAAEQTAPPIPAAHTYNMMTVLLGLDNKTPIPIPAAVPTADDPQCLKCSVTLGAVIETALLSVLPGDEPAPQPGTPSTALTQPQITQATARPMLAIRIHDNTAATLNEKELAVIVKRIQARFANQIVEVRALEILAPDDPDLHASVE